MITKDTYFIKFEDGNSAWLAPDKEIPTGALETEIRVMLFPEEGKVLKHKETGEINSGVWLKDSVISDYEEVEEYSELLD